jgi:hypothetical protein
MYKPSTYLPSNSLFFYPPTYVWKMDENMCDLPIYETYFLQSWLPRWNQRLTQLRVHPQLSD